MGAFQEKMRKALENQRKANAKAHAALDVKVSGQTMEKLGRANKEFFHSQGYRIYLDEVVKRRAAHLKVGLPVALNAAICRAIVSANSDAFLFSGVKRRRPSQAYINAAAGIDVTRLHGEIDAILQSEEKREALLYESKLIAARDNLNKLLRKSEAHAASVVLEVGARGGAVSLAEWSRLGGLTQEKKSRKTGKPYIYAPPIELAVREMVKALTGETLNVRAVTAEQVAACYEHANSWSSDETE